MVDIFLLAVDVALRVRWNDHSSWALAQASKIVVFDSESLFRIARDEVHH